MKNQNSNNQSLTPLEHFDVFNGVPKVAEVSQKPVVTPLESINVWNATLGENRASETEYPLAPEAEKRDELAKIVVNQIPEPVTESPKVVSDELLKNYHEELTMKQVAQKDRITPTSDESIVYQPRKTPDELKAEDAVQRLVADHETNEHATALAEQVQAKQGDQWPDVPERTAVPEPIIDTNYDRAQVNDPLRDELVEGVDEIAREEEGIKPNDIHGEESQLEAAEQEEIQSYPLYLEDGSVITIIKNQSWLMAGESKVITSIRLGPDKSSLFIGFNDRPSEQRTTDEWKTAFESSKLLGDGVHELERARMGDVERYKVPEKTEAKYQTREVSPKEAAGVKNIYDGKELVAEKVHIPAVAVEGAEVAEVAPDLVVQAAETEVSKEVKEQQQIIAEAVESVPGLGEAVVAEEKKEDGEAGVEEAQTPQQVHAKVLTGDNPDQADTSFATGIEDQIAAAQNTGESPVE